ncbi:MAG: hypothetical protein FGM37_02260 [Phycisphaerales bacterium]|nr:hypothetical protein [Phycisphaerales bacterium]
MGLAIAGEPDGMDFSRQPQQLRPVVLGWRLRAALGWWVLLSPRTLDSRITMLTGGRICRACGGARSNATPTVCRHREQQSARGCEAGAGHDVCN